MLSIGEDFKPRKDKKMKSMKNYSTKKIVWNTCKF